MIYTIEPLKITKELILNKVSEENLMGHYLGIPVTKGLHKSPLRNDTSPTCAFYRDSKGRLIFKDFRGDFSGDFIEVVKYKYNCSYYMALQIIANDIGLISRKDIIKNESKIKYSDIKFEESKSAIIQVELKDFTRDELNYWLRYGINPRTLKKFNVFSCRNIFLNGNLFHIGRDNELIFGYYGGIKNNIEQWRIYYPNKRKYKFISNWKSIQLQGASQLPKDGGEYLVITKSMKDVMALYECDIPAIAPISENLFVTELQYEKLISKFKHVILFYDNDLAGISNMNKIRKMFKNLHIVFIPRRYQVKDFSDFRKKYGRQETLNLIEQAKVFIHGKKKESE